MAYGTGGSAESTPFVDRGFSSDANPQRAEGHWIAEQVGTGDRVQATVIDYDADLVAPDTD